MLFLKFYMSHEQTKKPLSTSLFKQNLRTAILKKKVPSHKMHYFFYKIDIKYT